MKKNIVQTLANFIKMIRSKKNLIFRRNPKERSKPQMHNIETLQNCKLV